MGFFGCLYTIPQSLVNFRWKLVEKLFFKVDHFLICFHNLRIVHWVTELKFSSDIDEVLPKKTLNNFYVTGAIHCQNGIWNLQILFLYFFHAWNIWCCLMCSTRPHNFIHILPAELQLTCCKFSCCSRLSSTRTQISFKSAGVFV